MCVGAHMYVKGVCIYLHKLRRYSPGVLYLPFETGFLTAPELAHSLGLLGSELQGQPVFIPRLHTRCYHQLFYTRSRDRTRVSVLVELALYH